MHQRGFTLIELLVVMAIIGLLAGIVLIAINPAKHFKQSHDTVRRSDITNIYNALQQSVISKGAYPAETGCDSSLGSDTGVCPISSIGTGWDTSSPIYQAIVGEDLMVKLPTDPINDSNYYYVYEPDSPGEGECTNIVCDIWIGARLEYPKDAAKPIFRCSTNGSTAEGGGCKEVGNWYE